MLLAYGLSERVLPGVFELTRSRTALGRLEQPLTYWNAMGALSAMALVLLARLAGDPERRSAVRLGAAACAAPAGAALALTFSRGAIVAAAVGLVALVALAPTRGQLRAALVVAASAAVAAVLASALPAVRTLEGARGSEGAILLVGLVVVGAAGAFVARGDGDRALRGVRPALAVVGVIVAIGLVAGTAALETGTPSDGATVARLGSTDSNRYAYWGVALDAFADAPLIGHGAGSFGVLWLRDRTVAEVVRDAHSIWFETAAELGLIGVALLAALFGGTVLAARRAPPARVAGPAAALIVWAVHSALDWDWELPGGPTLMAVVLAGLVIARGRRAALTAGIEGVGSVGAAVREAADGALPLGCAASVHLLGLSPNISTLACLPWRVAARIRRESRLCQDYPDKLDPRVMVERQRATCAPPRRPNPPSLDAAV